jgi:hypothetical protein
MKALAKDKTEGARQANAHTKHSQELKKQMQKSINRIGLTSQALPLTS